MDNDERAAREWVQGQANLYRDFAPGSIGGGYFKAATTILRLLDRPVMPHPASVPDEVWEIVNETFHRFAYTIPGIQAAYRALYDHYTAPPKPKKIERWVIVNSAGELVSAYSTEAEVRERVIGDGCRIVKLVEADDAD